MNTKYIEVTEGIYESWRGYTTGKHTSKGTAILMIYDTKGHSAVVALNETSYRTIKKFVKSKI